MRRELLKDGLVYRYDHGDDTHADGLPGSEGAFLACSFWLVDALTMLGRHEAAERIFGAFVWLAGSTS